MELQLHKSLLQTNAVILAGHALHLYLATSHSNAIHLPILEVQTNEVVLAPFLVLEVLLNTLQSQ
jgi:hypothetical protein